MTERKQEIIKIAIEMIADQGYASLSMRALARASGMKLGALQYHFRTSEEMLRALVGYIADAYSQSFRTLQDRDDSPSVREIVLFILDDEAGADLSGDHLWPQLWAMQQVEPLVSDLVEDLYAYYYSVLTEALKRSKSAAPESDALVLLSLVEGTTIFMGKGRRWTKKAKPVRKAILDFVDQFVEKGYGTS
ncbi:MAG: TetR family transcriptional regulator [Pseudomonadales bacterium]|nr:TetR family transcriptional regulator [Pseudomonadales bacterium]